MGEYVVPVGLRYILEADLCRLNVNVLSYCIVGTLMQFDGGEERGIFNK